MNDELLRRAIALAAEARKAGDPPFGSLLAAADGTILAEERNATVSERDISLHPELKLAVWAARELTPEVAATTTMYTSCEPCGMCTGALARSGLGRVVYALSGEQLGTLKPTGSFPEVPTEGPALFDEARIPVEGYYG
ncbi:nucleoside deaminase [Phytomonospora endophytica]|uniref:tRNA(Arg) A34 adenosine deaminase TadA n=1 Tax=Phytomonospora endophytica TaxID=714109 RepID=A0A841F5L2_9ACTN|nr:nucleoside deaminase [Phytomonospora endophytica]MBB6032201.1 tRNA(Arg) A34 adenosine deaminase TadA [Phytomonospora endophytica]GIG68550.1 tRNA-specific adenosine deaminase [Phytomonospora endophytica]